jgi:hypothetical protein
MRRIDSEPEDFQNLTQEGGDGYTAKWYFDLPDDGTSHTFLVTLSGAVAAPLGFGKGGARDPNMKRALEAMQKAAYRFVQNHWESLPLNGELELTAAELRPYLPRETRGRTPTP